MYNALAGCVRRIEALGSYRFNVAINEHPVKLEFTTWLSGAEFIGAINSSGWRYSELFALLDTNSAQSVVGEGGQGPGRSREVGVLNVAVYVLPAVDDDEPSAGSRMFWRREAGKSHAE
jgi:hypothetical protein